MSVTPVLYIINPPFFTSPKLRLLLFFSIPLPLFKSHDYSFLVLSNHGIVIYVVTSFASKQSFIPHLPVFVCYVYSSCFLLGLLLLLLCMIMTIFSTRRYC